jgi:hypothetical protein
VFGTKSEKITHEIEQLELKFEELETRQSERAATKSVVTDAKGRPTRRPLPEHPPRVQIQPKHLCNLICLGDYTMCMSKLTGTTHGDAANELIGRQLDESSRLSTTSQIRNSPRLFV